MKGELCWWQEYQIPRDSLFEVLLELPGKLGFAVENAGRFAADVVEVCESMKIPALVPDWRGVLLEARPKPSNLPAVIHHSPEPSEPPDQVPGFQLSNDPSVTATLGQSRGFWTENHSVTVHPLFGDGEPPDDYEASSATSPQDAETAERISRLDDAVDVVKSWLEERPEDPLVQSLGAFTLEGLSRLRSNAVSGGPMSERETLLAQLRELAAKVKTFVDSGIFASSVYTVIRLVLLAFGIHLPG